MTKDLKVAAGWGKSGEKSLETSLVKLSFNLSSSLFSTFCLRNPTVTDTDQPGCLQFTGRWPLKKWPHWPSCHSTSHQESCTVTHSLLKPGLLDISLWHFSPQAGRSRSRSRSRSRWADTSHSCQTIGFALQTTGQHMQTRNLWLEVSLISF